ncbi:MAG: RnfABCDGE type electron transport complex subunit D [Chloroflexi bacterium]|nr:RnfABCDGE type electron transport complex subunit D [Chloroflexota bacterium]MCL5275030.1 RnfABCDGE type electron transport complex subunit D [Chloroflexota bacterium]
MKHIDNWLNRITMYSLAAYYLVFLLVVATLLSFAHILPIDPWALLFTTGFLIAVCWLTNTIFAKAFGVPANVESSYITALILALIITPLTGYPDLVTIGWIAVLAMASKYIIAIRGKHLFNPAAFAVALTALTLNQTASWWVGSGPMLPFVLIGGVLLVRKLRRWGMVASFFAATLLTSLALTALAGSDLIVTLQQMLVASPLLFFAFVILTEPLTMPPTRRLQIVYGALVGFLFSPQVHFGSFYITPELAILMGNCFSYLVSPKQKLVLTLKDKIHLGSDLWDFIFVPSRPLSYAPGQYMEWTLDHPEPDSRGNRRYFTLASSPTENNLRVGIKFPADASSYKQALLSMDGATRIAAAQLAGDFTLPRNPRHKCVLIAGGIGITPFRSMIKYLLDRNERRPITLFYAARTINDIVYHDVFNTARLKLGIRTIYTLTDRNRVPTTWKGGVGHISAEIIRSEAPDYQECVFYLSGPNAMVTEFEQTLIEMGVHRRQIKKDFFPGFA